MTLLRTTWGLPTWQYYAWLAVFNVIYVVPLRAIVVAVALLAAAVGRVLQRGKPPAD